MILFNKIKNEGSLDMSGAKLVAKDIHSKWGKLSVADAAKGDGR